MNEAKAKYVADITVIDPDTMGPVEVTIYKDNNSGGMFGIDSSYLLTLSDVDPVNNPFNGDEIYLIDEPASREVESCQS
jgi:hypothetical protein